MQKKVYLPTFAVVAVMCPGFPIDNGKNHKKGRNCVISSVPGRLQKLFILQFVFDALAWLQ